MQQQGSIAVVGAGVIGAAIAFALAREGRTVLLLDRAAPGETGASYGNAGHVATELLQPVPSPELLFGFWRMLSAFGGILDIPARRLPQFAPWALRFGAAAFRRRKHTQLLAPFVRPAVPALIGLLRDAGRPDLIRQNGHYEFWFGAGSARGAAAQAAAMAQLQVPTEPARAEVVETVRDAARATQAAALWFPKCAHVLDPLEVVRAFVAAATARGARFEQREVTGLRATASGVDIDTRSGVVQASEAVVCMGVWSAPMVAPFGLRAPLEAARGYHIQMPGAKPLVDAPIVYSDANVVVTPMQGRVRATSYMEFAGVDAPPDPRKAAWLRTQARGFGYDCPEDAQSWVGPRPVLPDYLPAMGRIAGAPQISYAFGHQHIGLTLAGMTANAMAALVAGRPTAVPIDAFGLERFGRAS